MTWQWIATALEAGRMDMLQQGFDLLLREGAVYCRSGLQNPRSVRLPPPFSTRTDASSKRSVIRNSLSLSHSAVSIFPRNAAGHSFLWFISVWFWIYEYRHEWVLPPSVWLVAQRLAGMAAKVHQGRGKASTGKPSRGDNCEKCEM